VKSAPGLLFLCFFGKLNLDPDNCRIQSTLGIRNMPTYHIEMMEGRTVDQKRTLVEEVTRVSVAVLGGSPESVDIIITDIPRSNWATAGKLWSEPR
jgi:4-oxalocrotonate tautomerase